LTIPVTTEPSMPMLPSGYRELPPTCALMQYYQCFPRGTFPLVID
jgi:hypothetical protein